MGSDDPVIPAQLLEADLKRVEGTLVTFRPVMLPGGARNFTEFIVNSPGTSTDLKYMGLK